MNPEADPPPSLRFPHQEVEAHLPSQGAREMLGEKVLAHGRFSLNDYFYYFDSRVGELACSKLSLEKNLS